MQESILIGRRDRILSIQSKQWKEHLAGARERIGARLNFMGPDHHQVRTFVVRELPRNHGRPLRPAEIARGVQRPLADVTAVLGELERRLFFLVRNARGEVSWAFPVTCERTPHRLVFSSGERTFAA